MQIVFLFYDGMTALDAIGPHEILFRLPEAKVLRVAEHAGLIETESNHLILKAEYNLSEISQADVLVVPGAGNATSLREHPKILDWIQKIHQTTTWTTSVCTGSLILGAAGILSGHKATSHWAVLDRLSQWGAEPVSERVVESGKIITGAGVSAGIDMALSLAAKLSGQKVAEALQLGIEYDPDPPFDVGSPAKANPEIREALKNRLLAVFEK
jgi:putative intracellular protease/amidase